MVTGYRVSADHVLVFPPILLQIAVISIIEDSAPIMTFTDQILPRGSGEAIYRAKRMAGKEYCEIEGFLTKIFKETRLDVGNPIGHRLTGKMINLNSINPK